MTHKIKKPHFYFIFFLVAISCVNNSTNKTAKNEKLVPDSLVCATINNLINDSIVSEFKLCDCFIDRSKTKVLNKVDSLQILKLDSLFTNEDLEFIFKQNSKSLDFNLNVCLEKELLVSFDSIKKLDQENFWEEYHKKYGNVGFCSISLPLFSKDYKTAIIKFSRQKGPLNAVGGTFILRKTGSHWKRIFCLDYWFS